MLIRLKGNKLIILSALIMSLLIMLGCSSGNDDDSVEDKSYSVSGKVVDANGEGVEGVILSFTKGLPTAETKSEGKWSMGGLTGEVIIKAVHTEYTILPSEIKVTKATDSISFTAVSKIKDARVKKDENDVVGGIITAIFGKELYIQDATGGLVIYSSDYPEVAIGDEIMVSGEMAQFHGLAEIKPASAADIKIIKEGAGVPKAEAITADALSAENGEDYEGQLVIIKDITVEDNNGTKNLDVTDSTGTAIVRVDNQDLTLEKGKSYASITGVVKYHYEEYKILPRTQADIVADEGNDNNDGDIPEGAVSKEIYELQGRSHQSPMLSQAVKDIDGIVTAKDETGFYMQELTIDNDDATSEAIYVLSSKVVAVGDGVVVAGTVKEYAIPHTADEWWIDIPRQLTITAIEASQVEVQSHGNDLPNPIILGTDRSIPENSIDDDSFDSFDITEDAIDFYESLEGMRVQVNNALVVGPTKYAQTAVLSNGGDDNSGGRTEFGGILIDEGDFNPERIIVEAERLTKFFNYKYAKSFDVGAKFIKPIVGIIGYDEGKYMLYNTADYSSYSEDEVYIKADNSKKDVTTINYAEDKLTIASFNVENLSAQSKPSRIRGIAKSIVNNLKNPDIVGLVEIQDNNGEDNDGVAAADQTYSYLIAAISNAGGATYDYVNIDPEDDQDGGAPGGNIRVGFIYRTDKVDFTAKGNSTATDAVMVEGRGENTTLSLNPGRIDPTNNAFYDSRKPLAAEFEFNGEKVFVIANHFNSKGGDAPLFGNQQPPVLVSQDQRREQAEVVNGFVREILEANSDANVVVLGDLNDFQFSEAVNILEGNELTNMMEQLDDGDRFSYIYEGNSQVLDHILVSNSLAGSTEVDAIHINSIYAEYGPIGIVSDHDPIMVQISNLGN